MRKIPSICAALSLALMSACTEVEVLTSSHLPDSTRPMDDPGKPSISLSQLKRIQAESGKPLNRHCDRNGSTLEVDREKQETSDWCWAATSRMVMTYHNGRTEQAIHDQCKIVSTIVDSESSRVTCCPGETAASKTECMGGGWPSVVFERYGFDYEVVGQALDWESLKKEICGHGPFLYVIDLRGGGRHALVVTGFNSVEEVVQTYDPTRDDFSVKTYDEFVGDLPDTDDSTSSYGIAHYRDYVQISPKIEDQP